jgi:hypothetical protein
MGRAKLRDLLAPNGLIYDMKQVLPTHASEAALARGPLPLHYECGDER